MILGWGQEAVLIVYETPRMGSLLFYPIVKQPLSLDDLGDDHLNYYTILLISSSNQIQCFTIKSKISMVLNLKGKLT